MLNTWFICETVFTCESRKFKRIINERNNIMRTGLSMWSFEKRSFAGDVNVDDFLRYCSDEGYEEVELLDCFWK